jgi:uncharacterized repeat protein (TIGR01451 family)
VGNVLTFVIDPTNTGVQIPAGQQIAIDIPVVLNNNPAVNTQGKQFTNVANWSFGRAIDLDDSGTIDPGEFFSPLPGDRGVSQPMTIAGPDLVMTKTGPANMNLGQWGSFTIDAHNTGLTDAWNVKLLDRFPDGPTGGMCDQTPEILSARVFAADGVTPRRRQGLLAAGTDYSLSYTAAPTCELTFTALSAQSRVGAVNDLSSCTERASTRARRTVSR